MLGLLVPGLGMGGGTAAVTSSSFGRIEYTMPRSQLEFTLGNDRLEFTLPDERLEFTGKVP